MKAVTETEKSVKYLSFSNRSFGEYPNLITTFLSVKLASLRAQFLENEIPPSDYYSIEKVIRNFIHSPPSHLEEIFPVDVFAGGGSIALHMNLSEFISESTQLPLSVINRSQSTADVSHTAFRITLFKEFKALHRSLAPLIQTLGQQAREWDSILTLSRTCLQDALPVSLGKSWSAHAAALQRRHQDLDQKSLQLLKINLGGTVIGSGEGASPAYRDRVISELIAETDLPLSRKENLYDAAQNSDDLAQIHSSLGLLTQVLMKFARDLRLLSSGPQGGFGELRLPKVQQGSAFFTHKINPVLPETLIQCGCRILGSEQTIQLALAHSELNLNVFEGLIAITLLDSVQSLSQIIKKFHEHCIRGIEPQRARCEELSEKANSIQSNLPLNPNSSG